MHALDDNIQRAIEALGWPGDAIVRLLLAALCGGLVGLEREVRGRQAGFRTHMLVCIGSAIVMVVSTSFAYHAWPGGHGNFNLNVDPGRIAYGVMTGVGFLGAGTILQHKGSVRGLTTAAALWCVATLGLAAGFGLYFLTLVATTIVVAALWGLDYVERWLPRVQYRDVLVRMPWEPDCVLRFVEEVRSAGFEVHDWTFKRCDDLAQVDVEIHIALSRRHPYERLVELLRGREDQIQLLAVRF